MAGGKAARRTRPERVRPAAPVVTERIPRWVVPAAYAFAVVALFPEFFFGGAWLLGLDTHALSYFARDFYTTFVQETGRFPLWQPYLFGGMPFVDGMHGDIFYPLSLALFFLDARTMWGWKVVIHLFLAGIFTYLWLRTLGLRRGPAFFGGLVYMMGADLVTLVYPGGDGKLFVSALAPLAFLLTERAVRSGRIADFALFGLGIAAVMFTSHMQAAYFTVWGVSLWFFFRLWQVKREGARGRVLGGRLAMFAVAGVLGVGAAAVQFLPPLQYLREWSHRTVRTVEAEAERGYEYSTSFSLNAEELVSLVVPEFPGAGLPTTDARMQQYWGANALKYNSEYVGLVPLLLIPILLLGKREPRTWFFCGLAALSLLYALGASTPVFRLFYLIPGVNLFRAPSIIIFLFGLSIATLGAIAAQRLIDTRSSSEDAGGIRKALWIGAGILGILALLESAGIITNAWTSVFAIGPRREQALAANLEAIRNGFWIAFLIAVAVAGTWEAMRAGLLGPAGALVALCIIAGLDLYRADRPFIRATVLYNEYQRQGGATLFDADPSIDFLQARRDAGETFRVFDLSGFIPGSQGYGHNDLAAHGIEQLAGHHGNEMANYRELIGGEAAANVLASEFRLLDLTNTRYLVAPGRLDPTAIPGIREVFAGTRSVVYERPSALDRAYLVGRYEVVSDDRAVARMLSPEFDGASTVVLPEPPAGIRMEPDPDGSVERVEQHVGGYTLRVTSDRPALLVVSENFYPAWHATIDGRDVPILRANYTFRAVPVSAGTSDVVFEYRSEVLGASAAVSVVILLLLTGLGLSGLIPRRTGKGSA